MAVFSNGLILLNVMDLEIPLILRTFSLFYEYVNFDFSII
jgi:hypothetical protein